MSTSRTSLPKDPSCLNFLIVDDIDNMRRSIKAMLKLIHFGNLFIEAINGLEAWRIITNQENRIDFIICDYKMPKMSGTELLAKIRANRTLRSIPFLMITADANMDVVAEAAEHEVDAYLTKPFVTATLEQKIMELLDHLHHPSPQAVLLELAREREDQGNLTGAIQAAKQAINPQHPSSRPFRELGRLYFKSGDLKKSMTLFKKASAANRLDVVSHHYLGQIYYREGNIAKAIEHYGKAMQISPRHYERAVKFALLLLGEKQTKEAEKVLKLVIRQPHLEESALENIADIANTHGLDRLAAKIYRNIIAGNQSQPQIQKKLGLALSHIGEHEEAAKCLEKAADNLHDDPVLILALAQNYLAMKRPIRADKWAMKLLRLEPGNLEAREILDQSS